MVQYDPQWVKSYYDAYGQKEWERWDRSPVERVKLAVHLHYLRQYLTPGDHVLEIGAGPGRFTQEIVKITDRLVVADISPLQLQLNRANAQRLDYSGCIERWVECDICALQGHFRDAEFDAVVCYGGPLSYVFGERERALAELKRVTRPGGRLLIGVMCLWGTVHEFLPAILKLDADLNRRIVASGDLGPDMPAAGNHFCHMFRAAELRELLERAGLAIEVMSASDCLAATWAEPVGQAERDGAAWQALLEMELEACREPGCLDMGTHLIAVCSR